MSSVRLADCKAIADRHENCAVNGSAVEQKIAAYFLNELFISGNDLSRSGFFGGILLFGSVFDGHVWKGLMLAFV